MFDICCSFFCLREIDKFLREFDNTLFPFVAMFETATTGTNWKKVMKKGHETFPVKRENVLKPNFGNFRNAGDIALEVLKAHTVRSGRGKGPRGQ
jgi:hypothetical protein